MSNQRKGFTTLRYYSKEQMHEYVEQAKQGDQRAYKMLFERFKPIMYNIAKRRMFYANNVEEIEDEVLMFLGRMFTKDIHKFDRSKAQFDSWLTNCFNMHLNGIPKRKKRVEITTIDEIYRPKDDGYQEYPVAADDTDTLNFLNSTSSFIRICRILLTHLDKRTVGLVIDKFWYGLKDRELEDKYDICYKGAWNQYSRALVKCKAVLEKYYKEK